MLLSLSSHIPFALRSPRVLATIAFSAAAIGGYFSWSLTRRKPLPEEIERERRDFLAQTGRIVDGSIIETHWQSGAAEPTPQTLVYSYRIAGVTYECAQDVSPLLDRVRHVRIDLPIQVRFDPRNPGDSIVVAESWSGLRLDPAHSQSFVDVS